MPRTRWGRWSSLLVLGWAAVACTGPVANEGPPTEVAFFLAEANEIERGATISLVWQVDHVGERAGEPSCALLRRVEGAVWEDAVAVPCVGSRTETPPYPGHAGSVAYRLRAVDRTAAGYQTRDVVVAFRTPSISIDPVNASVLTSGTVGFSATVQGAADAGVAWSTSCGSISGSGASVTFVAPAFTGSCTVMAASVADPAVRVSAVVAVGDVAIAIDPTSTTLDQGGTRTFTATVTGSADPSVAWQASEGSITASGSTVLYTAPMEDGSFTVTARSAVDPSAVATATVAVREARVELTPTSATMLTETSRTFFANLTGVADGALSWSTTGGTLTPSGAQATYAAPAAAGTYTVTVSSTAQPSASASVSVVVERVAIAITPASASVPTGGTLALTAAVTGTSDVRVAWSASCGSIDGSGSSVTFVAPALGGTCTVTAISLADGRRSAAATVAVTAPPTGAVAWSVTFGSEEDDEALLVATDAHGSVYVAGATAGIVGTAQQFPQGGNDAFVRKYDGNGVAQWTWQFGSAGADRIMLLEPQHNGDVIVGGAVQGTPPFPDGADDTLFVARFDAASQSVAWRIDFGEEVASRTAAMARDAQGNVLVALHEPVLAMARFGADGQELWTTSYPEVYQPSVNRLIVDGVGHAVSVGWAYRFNYVLRLDPDGDVTWSTYVLRNSPYYGGNSDVALDLHGNALVVGSGFAAGTTILPDIAWITKIDADGAESWVRDLDPGVDVTATAVSTAFDASVLVGGWSAGDLEGAGPGTGAYVAKYSGDGDRLWVRRFASVPVGFARIATDGQGSVYAVATVPGLQGSGGDVYLVKTAP